MAATFYSLALAELRAVLAHNAPWREPAEADPEVMLDRWFVGTVFALDPCGRFHSVLSSNGATDRCAAYWEALEKASGRLGGSISSGEGDPCDIFFERCVDDAQPVS